MCPSYKCVNLYGGFGARDTELKGKRRQSGGVQHLGLEVAFSTAFRSTEEGIWGGDMGESAAAGSPTARGHVAGGGGPWGQLLGVRVSHGGSGTAESHPHGLTEPLTAACGVGELAAAGPSCAAPAFPALFIARHVRLLPQPRSRLLLPQPRGGGMGVNPCPSGAAVPQVRAVEDGAAERAPARFAAKLHRPDPSPRRSGQPARCKANPILTPKPISQLAFGGAGKLLHTPSLPAFPAGAKHWSRLPAWVGEAAPRRRAHAFKSRVIGALCHSDAYNWRSIVSAGPDAAG